MTRVRFAPSPTGHLHVGGVRTCLFNYVYAKKHGGKLVIRIEDTDTVRSTRESESVLLQDLARLGLEGDEGPVQGGPHAPYRQSERQEIFNKYVEQLLSDRRAYFCFCPAKLIEEKRELALKSGMPPVYDGTCARLDAKSADERIARGEKAGVRFRAPMETVVVKDLVRGDVEFRAGTVGDFLITRTPEAGERIGMPVYNFSCAVDDHLMELTHVIRGEDHLSNTARQVLLYRAFGWDVPAFAHLPMVVGMDRQKLSKRTGDAAAHDYLERGYLSEVLLNFLALLGWSPPTNAKFVSGHPEVFSLSEMVAVFDLPQLHRSPAAFDPEKLAWMNGFYIRMLDTKTLWARAKPFFMADPEWATWMTSADGKARGEPWMADLMGLVRSEASVLADLPELARFGMHPLPLPEDDQAKLGAGRACLIALRDQLPSLDLKQVTSVSGLKGRALFEPLRLALMGKAHGPEVAGTLVLLGEAEIRRRLARALGESVS